MTDKIPSWQRIYARIKRGVGARFATALGTFLAYISKPETRDRSVVIRVLERSGVRFLPMMYPYAIGHLVPEMDCYLREQALGIHPKFRAILLAPYSKVCNHHWLTYLRGKITVVTNELLCNALAPLTICPNLRYEIAHYMMDAPSTVAVFRLFSDWGKRPPVFSLTDEDKRAGHKLLRRLGVPEGAEFVCVHVRQPGNRPQDAGHIHRNADIRTYIPMMNALAARGVWCIRMGDPFMDPLPEGLPNTVDWAHHPLRSVEYDIFLCASCRFFLGTQSGLIFLASTFGTPCAGTNYIPFSMLAPKPGDIFITKRIVEKDTGRILTYKEVLDGPTERFFLYQDFEDGGLTYEDNTPEEITEVALEMMERTAGTAQYTAEDDCRAEAYSLLLRPGHFAYGSRARLGRDFGRRWESLLPASTK